MDPFEVQKNNLNHACFKLDTLCKLPRGSYYCLDCEQYYGENCKILYSRQKLSTNHEFIIATDFIPEVKLKCIDHNEAFFFVYKDCDVLVYGYYVTENHNGHKLSQVKDEISKLKTKIENDFLTKFNQTSGNVSKLKHSLSLFNGQVESVIRSITGEGKKVKSMVDKYTANKGAFLQEQARQESEK